MPDTSETPQVDINAIIAEVISTQVDAIYEKLKTTGINGLESIRVRMHTAYQDYLRKVHKEFSLARSFFLRDTPTNLYDFYVPVGIANSKTTVNRITSKALDRIGQRIVICGSAGCGKSILLKHLLLDSVKSGFKVPVFCELKDLNEKDSNVIDLLKTALENHGFKINASALEVGLEKGHFIFLFDGYDELDPSRRIDVGGQIRQIAKKYEFCTLVLTSRPDPEFSGWDGFSRTDVIPLTLDQSCELVGMLPFEKKLKEHFLTDLKDHLYAEHQTFLSNPLLLTIMLLTYDENADIPRKLSVFYNQAYEALFQKHDARKGAYKRKRKTNLDIQDFGKVLSAFCLITYDRRQFKFSEAEALTTLTKAREIVEISFGPQDFLTDLMQATCLLIEDGLFLTFAHRSFQEYFVAKFISEAPQEKKEALIQRYKGLMRRDNVIPLLYEMDPHSVEHALVIPVMEKLLEKTDLKTGKLSTTRYLAYLNLLFERVGLMEGQLIWVLKSGDAGIYHDVIALLLRKLNHLHGPFKTLRNDKKIIDELKRLGDGSNDMELNISEISPSQPLAKLLFGSNIYSGGKSFAELLQRYTAIQIKHTNRTESLDQLLSTPRNSTSTIAS